MKRLFSGTIGATLVAVAIFALPGVWFFWLSVGIMELAAIELVRLSRQWTPRAPLWLLLVLVPVASTVLGLALPLLADPPFSRLVIAILALGLVYVIAIVVLCARTPVEQALPALGILSFAVPYLALPAVSLSGVRSADPWLLILLLAIVWTGDTAAYYGGSAFGRHKLAPRVSPNKTWEGAVAGFVGSLAACLAWSLWRLDRVDTGLLVLAGLCAVAAQLGDLVESMMKRGANVKDSGTLLPGHGGALDRLDALLFSAPLFYAAILLVGAERFSP